MVSKKNHLFSRIHIDDIVEIISICIDKDCIRGIYNLCDNKPASSEDVMREACRLLDLDFPRPVPLESLNLSKAAKGFYSESKKVCNKKLLKDLSYELIHADYFSGLILFFFACSPDT